MRRDELKPCPFCGSLNVDHAAPAIDGPPRPECLDCGASARDLRTWNRRAGLEAEQPVAVEPEPVAWMYQFKTNAPVLMVEKRNWAETHFEWTETPLYAHRPVSALVNAEADADVVERWQPIETAPKDGTKIIATGKYGVRVVWWGAGAFNRKINAYDRDWTDCVTYGFKLTHWRPLPAPPTTTRIADSAEAGGSATLSKGADHGHD